MPPRKEDRRAQYSKRVIREALYELMQEMPAHKITVTELCRRADVNRSTFYAFYNDIDDLRKQIVQQFYELQRGYIDRAAALLKTKGDITRLTVRDLQEISRIYLNTVKENKTVYRLIYNSHASRAVLTGIDQVYFGVLSENMDEDLKRIFRRSFSFVSGGTASLTVSWLETDCAEPVESLSRTLAYFFNGVFNGQRFVAR